VAVWEKDKTCPPVAFSQDRNQLHNHICSCCADRKCTIEQLFLSKNNGTTTFVVAAVAQPHLYINKNKDSDTDGYLLLLDSKCTGAMP